MKLCHTPKDNGRNFRNQLKFYHQLKFCILVLAPRIRHYHSGSSKVKGAGAEKTRTVTNVSHAYVRNSIVFEVEGGQVRGF
jgi:hypothetical protein